MVLITRPLSRACHRQLCITAQCRLVWCQRAVRRCGRCRTADRTPSIRKRNQCSQP